jgi:N-acetylmuramoyl-L-alanine amidase
MSVLRFLVPRSRLVLPFAALAGVLLSAQAFPPVSGQQPLTERSGDQVRLAEPTPVFIIDPGHGGDDLGVRGAGAVPEKHLTLDLARRVRLAIEARGGALVILTRDNDRAVTPDDRATVANAAGGALFISLHFNASLRAATVGAEVYYHRPEMEAPNPLAEAPEGSPPAGPVWLSIPGDNPRAFDLRRWERVQDRHTAGSAALAGMLVDALTVRLPMGARPLRQIPSRVLAGLDMPAALIEVAYLTHPGEAATSGAEAFQSLIADAVAEVATRFRGRPVSGIE